MHMEFVATPYTFSLDLEPKAGCNGTVVRLPDGVEGRFNSSDALLSLLEGLCGGRWWQTHADYLTTQVAQLQRLLRQNEP